MDYGQPTGMPLAISSQPGGHGPFHQSVKVAVTPWHQRSVVRVLLAVLALGVIAVCGGGLLLLLGFTLGPQIVLLAAAFAALPVPVLLLGLLWLDRYEPEPWHYLGFAFGWGAAVATALALLINSTSLVLYSGSDAKEAETAVAIYVAPPVEETLKAVPLFIFLGLTLFGRRHIHSVVDGIVYAGFSAVGFAFTENILYFGQAYVTSVQDGRDGFAALFVSFIMRAVLSPFAHPMFTALTGIGVGLAVRARSWPVRIAAPLGGLLLATGLHALWNFFASSGNIGIMLAGYLGIMVPMFLLLVGVAVWLRARESTITSKVLPAYVAAGWLTTAEVASLSSIRDRLLARNWARSYGGSPGAKAMQSLQLAATRLAFLRDEALRGISRADYAEQERDLLATITSRRQTVLAYVTRWTGQAYPNPVPAQATYGGSF